MSEQYDYSALDFTFNGVSASSVGIKLCEPIVFSPAVPRVKTIQIPGRSGDLHIDEGAFNSRTGTAKCFVIDSTIGSSAKMANVAAFCFSKKGYLKLVPHDDPEHFWYARVSNGAQIASRLGILAPFSIVFDCKPFRYTADAETIINYTGGTQTLTNPTGFIAYPLLYVTATGAGSVYNQYGSVDILDATNGEIIIDCEDHRAYYDHAGGVSADHLISGNNFPTLQANGDSGFTFTTGITLRVAPRWRTL